MRPPRARARATGRAADAVPFCSSVPSPRAGEVLEGATHSFDTGADASCSRTTACYRPAGEGRPHSRRSPASRARARHSRSPASFLSGWYGTGLSCSRRPVTASSLPAQAHLSSALTRGSCRTCARSCRSFPHFHAMTSVGSTDTRRADHEAGRRVSQFSCWRWRCWSLSAVRAGVYRRALSTDVLAGWFMG